MHISTNLLFFGLLLSSFTFGLETVVEDAENQLPNIGYIGTAGVDSVRLENTDSTPVQGEVPKTTKPRERPVMKEKVHPTLRNTMTTHDRNEMIRVVVTFQEEVKMPRLPSINPNSPRDSPANTAILNRRSEMVQMVDRARSNKMGPKRTIFEHHGAQIIESFWISNSFVVDLPVGKINLLEQVPEVEYIQPQFSTEPPPQNAINTDDIDDGRTIIRSDWLRDASPSTNYGFVGLLDTGVNANHELLSNPSHIDYRRDCTASTADCTGGNPADNCRHGTSSASIITANAKRGNAFEGTSRIILDSWNVYTSCLLNIAAAVKAFQRAVLAGDFLIVAEMQASESNTGAIATAANNAFDAGIIIVAANGNFGSAPFTVRSPAVAHKVLGVGSVYFSGTTLSSSGRGPTSDGRYKPDISAPTLAEAADGFCNTCYQNFGGTSGATPFASAATALARNWMRNVIGGGIIDPGQVYAFIIASGVNPSTPTLDNNQGAGLLRIPTVGKISWGSSSFTATGQQVDISIPVDYACARVAGAIWWAESPYISHNDLDISLINPSGTTVCTSITVSSVYEKCTVKNPVVGNWKLRIRGYAIARPQLVYWSWNFGGE